MFGKKYKMLNIDYVTDSGVVLHPIQALKNFGGVKKGDRGGYIESYSNLSQKGNCWVGGEAKVYGGSEVTDYAIVDENAIVCNTFVGADSVISGSATLIDSSITGDTYVDGNALIVNTIVSGCTIMDDSVVKSAYALELILNDCYICDNAVVDFYEMHCINNASFGRNAIIKNSRDFVIVYECGNCYTIYRDSKTDGISIFTYDYGSADFYLISASEEQAINDIYISLDASLFKDEKERRSVSKKIWESLINIGNASIATRNQ